MISLNSKALSGIDRGDLAMVLSLSSSDGPESQHTPDGVPLLHNITQIKKHTAPCTTTDHVVIPVHTRPYGDLVTVLADPTLCW